jgi:hypothetical protein
LFGSWPPTCSFSIGSGGFVTVDLSGVGFVTSRPTPNLEAQGLHFPGCYPLTCLALPGDGAPANIVPRVIGTHRPPHDKAVVLEENLHLRTETDPVSETSCSLEYQTMRKIKNKQ